MVESVADRPGLATLQQVAAGDGDDDPYAEYRVRRGDTLWAIAGEQLGNPFRWPEILAVSAGIAQPGGERLIDPDYVRTGWILHLPSAPPAVASDRSSRIVLAGSPRGDSACDVGTHGKMVADGAGQLWILGAWRLTRVDPATGRSTSWDAADDAAFAQAGYGTGSAPGGAMLAASTGSGVWLVGGDRARLFDGQRFVRDLRVPAGLMGEADSGSVTFVADLAEVGSAVWMSVQTLSDEGSIGRVVRWSEGTWTAMSRDEDGIGGYLAVDTDGGVWAGGRWDTGVSSGSTPAVRRWDGSGWTRPGDGLGDAPAVWGDVVADPTGGVWVLTERAEAGVSDGDGVTLPGAPTLHRFDGATWRSFSPNLNRWAPGEMSDRSGWLAVTPSGHAWVVTDDYDEDAGESPATTIAPDGTIGRPGSTTAEQARCQRPAGGLAAVGDAVFALDPGGVLSIAGRTPTRAWEGETTAHPTARFSSLTALSRDEASIQSNSDEGLFRYRDGVWAPFGPDQELGVDTYVIASDGALWILDGDDRDLTRTSHEDTRRVASEVEGSRLLAGGRGSVWVGPFASDDPMLGYQPDGARVKIGRPRGFTSMCALAGGPDGSVWVGAAPYDKEEGEYDCISGVRKLARWEGGRWKTVERPRAMVTATAVAVSDDGAGWVLFTPDRAEGSVIGRYVDGRWTVFETPAYVHELSFLAAPGGRVCAGEAADTEESIVCYGPRGEVARYDLTGTGVFDSSYATFSVASDGSVWVLGPQVARLGEPLP